MNLGKTAVPIEVTNKMYLFFICVEPPIYYFSYQLYIMWVYNLPYYLALWFTFWKLYIFSHIVRVVLKFYYYLRIKLEL